MSNFHCNARLYKNHSFHPPAISDEMSPQCYMIHLNIQYLDMFLLAFFQ